MPDPLQRATTAKRESKHIEFKSSFDPGSAAEWCELIKDIVALANSGGGIILFGVDNFGKLSGIDQSAVVRVDPADIHNKVCKYVGNNGPDVSVVEVRRDGAIVPAFRIHPASLPLVFQSPGTYDAGLGKQRTAFGIGTVYFRHGAKSEPGTSEDLRAALERQLEFIRKSWAKGVRKVVQAPPGSQLITVLPKQSGRFVSGMPLGQNHAHIMPVLLTRDSNTATGSLIYEEISEGIFDEINNVVDANRVLAREQPRFLLGQEIYYRVYAERQYVRQKAADIALLFHAAACEMYAPALFWTLSLTEEVIAGALADIYLRGKGNAAHFLIRVAALLGDEFCDVLAARWNRRWKRHPQPPSYYLTFLEMRRKAGPQDPRLLAARISEAFIFDAAEPEIRASELLRNQQKASLLLSTACMAVFNGRDSDPSETRTLARNLDYISYGLQLREKAALITKSFADIIGNPEPSGNATAATTAAG